MNLRRAVLQTKIKITNNKSNIMQSSVEQLNKRVVLTSEKVMYEGANIEVLQMFTRFSMEQPYHLGAVLGGGHRYSWILMDTVFFGYLANFWDPSIQVSKKNMFLRQTS